MRINVLVKGFLILMFVTGFNSIMQADRISRGEGKIIVYMYEGNKLLPLVATISPYIGVTATMMLGKTTFTGVNVGGIYTVSASYEKLTMSMEVDVPSKGRVVRFDFKDAVTVVQ